MILDQETENHKEFKRLSNPFTGTNYVVMRGFKVQGDTCCTAEYFPNKHAVTPFNIPDDVSLLVGHSIKFDLLYEWHTDEMKAFFKRGGKVWCTQYAEYLISGQKQSSHMNSLDSIVESYGGRLKIDEVKILWNQGVLTSQIDQDLLQDYLIGTKEEGRNSGDIGNTELVFLGQIKRAMTEYPISMIPMIQARMDGLLCTTEMEYNGLKIDVQEAARATKLLTEELVLVSEELEQYVPETPEGYEFNWGSKIQVSCLIFGGTVKYVKSAPYLDKDTGELARFKAVEKQPLFCGVPCSLTECSFWSEDGHYIRNSDQCHQDLYVSGKKKGTGKFKNVSVLGEIKTKKQDFFFEFPGYTDPEIRWESKNTDGKGDPIYFTNADVIEELGTRDIPFLKALGKRQDITKDLSTYYVRYDPKKKMYVGMLTCVDPRDHIVHHSLNHTSTVTSRLSSSDPNLQNTPRADTSEVKKMFRSRFKDGKMIEADYSQLEVVVQGLLSGDTNLIRDLNKNIDFHCKRVSMKHDITYREAVDRCKNEDHPQYTFWKSERTACKGFSFQRAYGAGAVTIASSTGMLLDDVKYLIESEEIEYKGVILFNDSVEASVRSTAKPFNDPSLEYKTYRRGYWQSPTGTVYTFRSYDAMDWQQARGQKDSFMPTEIKNYPTQGTGGEIVQIILGKLWRHFVSNNNYNNSALLCNTVHDCVWIDATVELYKQVARDIKPIMESVPQALKELYGMDVPVPFPVDVEAGPTMYALSSIH